MVTAVNGDLKVAAVIQNRGSVAIRVTNVVLTATFVEPSGVALPVQNLFVDEGQITTFVPFALSPGEETSPTNFATILITLDTAQAILERANQLWIGLGPYELDDATGKPFNFDMDAVSTRTALLTIDYGKQRSPELYQVATNFDPAHPGVTVSTVLRDILHIPYSAESRTGLTAVRDVAVQTSGGPQWSVVETHRDGPVYTTSPYGTPGDPYDFDSIELHGGDVLRLTAPGTKAKLDGGTTEPALAMGPAADAGFDVATYGGVPDDGGLPIPSADVPVEGGFGFPGLPGPSAMPSASTPVPSSAPSVPGPSSGATGQAPGPQGGPLTEGGPPAAVP
jgi:hypothetical protein